MKRLLAILLLFLSTNLYAGSISDTLTDWNGDTLTGVTFYIQAYSLTGDTKDKRPANAAAVATTTTNPANGTYTLTGLTAGQYYLVLFQCNDTYLGYSGFTDAYFIKAE